MTAVSWTLYKSQTIGQMVRNSYKATVTGGLLYRETLSALSGQTSAVSGAGGQQSSEVIIAEASIFVASATDSLAWTVESSSQEGDILRTLYSAAEAGSGKTLYLSIATQAELPGTISGAQGNGGNPKNASMSLSGPV
jgi:hypothetical protein